MRVTLVAAMETREGMEESRQAGRQPPPLVARQGVTPSDLSDHHVGPS